MAQETYYFSHDYNPLSDTKMLAFVGEHGAVGYGIFWRITEKLHLEDEHKLPLKKYLYMGTGKEMSVPWEKVQEIVESCISPFELFISDGECFWSNRVFINIYKRAETLENKSKAGKESARIRKMLKEYMDSHPETNDEISTGVEQVLTDVQHVLTDVQHVSTDVQHVSTKERKGKKIKGKKIKGN